MNYLGLLEICSFPIVIFLAMIINFSLLQNSPEELEVGKKNALEIKSRSFILTFEF